MCSRDEEALAGNLHPADRAELAAAGVDVHRALAGQQAQASLWKGELFALFGCVPLEHRGVPWMLCTAALDRVPRRAVAACATRVVAEWKTQHRELVNIVHRRNVRAQRFLLWLGFSILPDPCGPSHEFLLFRWRFDDV